MRYARHTGDELLELTGSLIADESRDVLLDRIAAQVLLLLPGATGVTITLVEGGRATTVIATDDKLSVLDGVQHAAGDGPCWEALNTRAVVRADISLARLRWPAFAQCAADTGVLTMMSCPLFLIADSADAHRRATGGRFAGAVNLWSSEPDAFEPVESVLIAMFTTAVSAVVLTERRWARARAQAVQLLGALESRDVIATAKGIVMARHHLGPEDAFQWLTDVSQRTNRKIRELADLITADPDVVGTTR